MRYESFPPSEPLKEIVKEYWVFEDEHTTPQSQKIIPDGYSEIIIHYGDPYMINLHGSWEVQSSLLFSNQISKYFFLENTGTSGMIGIKLHPASFYEIFGNEMSGYTDKVFTLADIIPDEIAALGETKKNEIDVLEKIKIIEDWLLNKNRKTEALVRSIIDTILAESGKVDIEGLAQKNNISLRQLERQFKKVVGISPKFYSRIIRFSNIFTLMESGENSWVRLALQSGYFDQSHFIKNFKEFTGEDPSTYGFNETNLANFFLKK